MKQLKIRFERGNKNLFFCVERIRRSHFLTFCIESIYKHDKNLPKMWSKDRRYVWRGDIDIDKKDVEALLKFILKNRG